MKYTSGPWRIVGIGEPWTIKEETAIANCENASGVYSVVVLGKANTNAYTKQDAEANAKLIAAAPELLDALKEIIKHRGLIEELKLWNLTRAVELGELAIKKATE